MRALAVFFVIAWHFTHGYEGTPVPFEYVPALVPFSLLDEGHTGVALFMTLSGYLFAKLLDGRRLDYWKFLRNRLLRLVPLLALVLAVVGFQRVADGMDPYAYAGLVAAGLVLPTLPNGAWSITTEFHFYLVLPLLLALMRRSVIFPALIVVAAVALRALLHYQRGEVQSLAYWTILGRIDQFVLGMLGWQLRGRLAGRHLLAGAALAAFALLYWDFDRRGGFYLSPSYPSPRALWIFLPTIEGLAYAIGIAWYDNSFRHPRTGVSRFVGRIGEYSYSIYLLHFFVVFAAARLVHERIMDLSNFYLACLWSVAFLLLMTALGYVSFRYVERPFLALRRPYVREK